MGKIKEMMKKFIYSDKYSSETYISFLRRGGGQR